MGKLVQDRHNPTLSDCVGHLRAEHIGLGEGHRAGVLHRPRVEFGHKQLVVFVEWVGQAELVFEVGETFSGDVENVVGVEVVEHRGSGKDPQRDGFAVRTHQLTVHRLVGAGDEGGDVARNSRGCAKAEHLRLALGHWCWRGLVTHYRPALWRGDSELKCCFEIGLFKNGKHSARIGNFKLGVQVNLSIHRVGELVQTFTGVGEQKVRVDHHCVVLG